MADPARNQLALLLAAQDDVAASVQLRPRPPDAVRLHVDGVGEVALPVSAEQARALQALARPARFGRGEDTLTDPAVRDTWEVPRDAVRVDWAAAADLPGALESVRTNLGLPDGCRLTAELHSLLVYETGQFFLPHQDSEKSDGMVATLVVTLPSRHAGGELVVHHLGEATGYRGSPTEVSLVGFYADCRHEVRPVTSGYRVTVTYNLMLAGAPVDRVPDDVVLARVGELLRRHFATPVQRWRGDEERTPRRLVFLLDHEYTEHGLSWQRLKGTDTSRAAMLRAGAEAADCEAALALTEVQEIWDAYPTDDDDRGHRYRSWYDNDDDEEDEDEDGEEGGDEYELNSLIDSNVRLTWWTDPDGTSAEEISLRISDDDVCTATPSSTLTPYESEYEGYMGNYGNTLDRWYRRAAVVVSPRGLGFAHRAEASPGWALRELASRADDPDGARQDAATVTPFWDDAVRALDRSDPLLPTALAVADLMADPELAAMVLRPFAIEGLDSGQAAALAALTRRYGSPWTTALLTSWLDRSSTPATAGRRSRTGWLSSLADLTAALRQADPGGSAADLLTELCWPSVRALLEAALADRTPSSRLRALQRLGPVLTGVLTAAALSAAPSPLDDLLAYCRQHGDDLEPCLRTVALAVVPPISDPTGTEPARSQCATDALTVLVGEQVARLRARLAAPRRAPDDWSIELPPGCGCPLCATLRTFLADPARQTFEWPLAQDGRSHVHRALDRAELPVRHVTRRTGRPYTLVLTKTAALFDRVEADRAQDLADLARLGG